MPLPFTEKYRPKTLEEISGNTEVMKCLRSFDIRNLPNMLFYGPPGTGKTTAIRALLRTLPAQNVLELNASDHRGIDTVRNEIKEFASVTMDGPKVVVLDEADSMSKEAQGALRRIIEDYKNTRFCFICNYFKKIIQPIVSRCTRFRFSSVTEPGRIREICHREGIVFDEDAIEEIARFSDGDMRKVMNDIQGIKGSYGKLTVKNVQEFFGMASDEIVEEIFEVLQSGGFEDCKRKIVESASECGSLVSKLAVLVEKSSHEKKMVIFKQLADIEHRIALGCCDSVQINAIISAFILNR